MWMCLWSLMMLMSMLMPGTETVSSRGQSPSPWRPTPNTIRHRRGSWVSSSRGGASKAVGVNRCNFNLYLYMQASWLFCKRSRVWTRSVQARQWLISRAEDVKGREREKQSLSALGALLYVGARRIEIQLLNWMLQDIVCRGGVKRKNTVIMSSIEGGGMWNNKLCETTKTRPNHTFNSFMNQNYQSHIPLNYTQSSNMTKTMMIYFLYSNTIVDWFH